MTSRTEFDVAVIGAGPGGYATALYGALAGLSIAVVEQDKVGGTCLHRGCIPAKTFLQTASVVRTVAGAKEFGVQASQPSVDFALSQTHKQKVVDQLHAGLAGLIKHRQITVFAGTGALLPGRRVQIDGDRDRTQISARHVVLATGSAPRALPGFDIDHQLVLTSDDVLDLESLPRSVAIIGGGVIGCEFASMFADLGVQVTMLEALDTLLPNCDHDVVARLARSFRQRGVAVHTGVEVKGHARGGSTTTVSFGDGQSVTVDAVVLAVGRYPVTDDLLVEGTGVTLDDHGFVIVDRLMRTTESGVWAVGDVVNTPQLAHVGFAEGILTVRGILGEPAEPIDYSRVPWCIYSHPEVAYAGLTETEALQQGIEIVVKKYPMGANSRAHILDEIDGMVKVIAARRADGSAGAVLGVHLVGPWASEQLGQGYMAVNMETTPDQIAKFIQPHPTLSESFGETVMSLTGRGLHLG
jgi:dihydrolipoamide dehydrogenase